MDWNATGSHCCLPELDRNDITTTFLRKHLDTAADFFDDGRHGMAGTINHRLAGLALQNRNGSRFPARGVEKPQVAGTFAVRSRARYTLFANGCCQLNPTTGWMNACAFDLLS